MNLGLSFQVLMMVRRHLKSGKETLFLKQCNPQITKSGLLIFEVPDKKAYDLHLSGGFWNGKTTVVKLTTK